ncbi:MAG: hypothetical protein NTY19_16620, partial [Planctomycetota bacterium]|nr:hypothetical protein [Planctomycetota bacterium]
MDRRTRVAENLLELIPMAIFDARGGEGHSPRATLQRWRCDSILWPSCSAIRLGVAERALIIRLRIVT